MKQRIKILTLGTAALLAAACAQHDQDSLSAGLSEPAPPAEARESETPREPGAVALQAALAPVEPVSQPVVPEAPEPDTRVAARQVLGSMGLFGQLPAQRSGESSPLDGAGDLTRVTFTTEGADFDPDVDPTGRFLVYASTRHRATADLYVKSVHGTAITQLTSDPANECLPAFSPDGQKIAFCSDRSGNWDIYVMDAQGGQPVQITNDATDDIHPSFSPDGKQLVYASSGSRSGQWELVVVDIDSPTTKRVIGLGLNPNWSPADNRIVFQRARQRGTRWFSVWTVTVTDGDVSPPTEVAVSSNAAVITPDWSPDGRHIVFCTVVDPAADDAAIPTKSDVWVVSADGANRVRLTQGVFANTQPVWSATDAIFFVSNRGQDGVENVWSLQATQARQMVERQTPAQMGAVVVP